MILVDVNVVVAAHRADHPHHGLVHPWFTTLTTGDDPFWVPDPVWAGFVRISTNRRVFPVPTPLGDAFEFVHAVRDQPNHLALVPTERHLDLFEEMCTAFDAPGDLSADAYIAAMALDHAARWCRSTATSPASSRSDGAARGLRAAGRRCDGRPAPPQLVAPLMRLISAVPGAADDRG